MDLKKIPLILIGIIFISSCKKDAHTPAPIAAKFDQLTLSRSHRDTAADVYVAGLYYSLTGKTVAVYWRNGVIHRLTDSTTNVVGEAIAVYGNDVYVSGSVTNADNSNTAVYWRNGVMHTLQHNALAANGQGIAISENGHDIYIAGSVISGNHYKAVYWKNGVVHTLPGGSTVMTANGITLNGHDVYTAGLGITSLGGEYAIYWKNNTPFILGDTTSFSLANAIAVTDNKVYVAGETLLNGGGIGTYWKNGVKTTLVDPSMPDDGSVATGIVVAGHDTYISTSSGLHGSYWVDHTPTHLFDAQTGSVANAIALFGCDVYTGGTAFTLADSSIPIASYWVNHTLVRLPTPIGGTGLKGSGGLSIAVTAHNNCYR